MIKTLIALWAAATGLLVLIFGMMFSADVMAKTVAIEGPSVLPLVYNLWIAVTGCALWGGGVAYLVRGVPIFIKQRATSK